MSPRVFADANVLYASAPRDILIELALAGIIQLRWSRTILDELAVALVRTRPEYTTAKAARLVAVMIEALPDAMTAPPEQTSDVFELLDSGDVHVVAAAWHGECEAILTFNLKDFPSDALAKLDQPLAAKHPDAFLVELLTTNAAAVLATIENVRQNLTNPPMAPGVYADALARAALPQTAELLRHLLPS